MPPVMDFGLPPEQIRSVQHFMKLAEEHDDRNIVVAYYARMSAILLAMKIIPGTKPPDVSKYLSSVMEWLEKCKTENADAEGIGNETVAQAMMEEYMLKIYDYGYRCDCKDDFHKNMVKAYYTANLLCEVLTQFGPLSEDLSIKSKTSKYRATYIHNLLKQGLKPLSINTIIVDSEEEAKQHTLTLEQVNARRAARGECPLSEVKPAELTEEEFEEARKRLASYGENGNPELMEDLRKIKERIAAEHENYVDTTFLPPEDDNEDDEVIAPTRIVEMGPRDYPEPRIKPQLPPAEFPPAQLSASNSVASLDPSQTEKALKYCKFASSALNYDDVKTAIDNLEKALHLCRFGIEKN